MQNHEDFIKDPTGYLEKPAEADSEKSAERLRKLVGQEKEPTPPSLFTPIRVGALISLTASCWLHSPACGQRCQATCRGPQW